MTMSGAKPKSGVSFPHDEIPWPKKHVTVTISGPVGVGKSAIAYRIREALGGLQIGMTYSGDLDQHRGDPVTADVHIIERVAYEAPASILSARYKRYAAWPVVLWCRLRGHAGQQSWGGTNRCLRCGDAR